MRYMRYMRYMNDRLEQYMNSYIDEVSLQNYYEKYMKMVGKGVDKSNYNEEKDNDNLVKNKRKIVSLAKIKFYRRRVKRLFGKLKDKSDRIKEQNIYISELTDEVNKLRGI